MTLPERKCLSTVLDRLNLFGLSAAVMSKRTALLSCASELLRVDQYIYSEWLKECQREGLLDSSGRKRIED